MNQTLVGSTGYETQAMHWGTSIGAITLKNGRLLVSEDATKLAKPIKQIMQNYVTLTLEDMVIDGTVVEVQKYAGYPGADAKYNGVEVPLFNANNASTMTLKNSTINLPSASTRGIYIDNGALNVENTTVNGYISVEGTGTVTMDANSKCKGVVDYFTGADKITNQ